MNQLSTKEKCTLRDLIKIEIKSLTKDGYGEYRYYEYEYCAFLLKMGRKLKLDIQQKIKANNYCDFISCHYSISQLVAYRYPFYLDHSNVKKVCYLLLCFLILYNHQFEFQFF